MRYHDILLESHSGLFHGSRRRFRPGFILKPNRPVLEAEEQAVERILEMHRPTGMLQRSESVFMVDRPDQDLIERAGGYADFIYEVAAVGRIEKCDVSWWAAILNGGALDFDEGNHAFDDELGSMAEAYWNGTAGKRPLWEFRASSAKITRLVSQA